MGEIGGIRKMRGKEKIQGAEGDSSVPRIVEFIDVVGAQRSQIDWSQLGVQSGGIGLECPVIEIAMRDGSLLQRMCRHSDQRRQGCAVIGAAIYLRVLKKRAELQGHGIRGPPKRRQ